MIFKHTLALTFVFSISFGFASETLNAQSKNEEDSRLDRYLATKRWREGSFGVSIRPPLGSTLKRRTTDDAVLRIEDGRKYAMTLYLKQTNSEMKINNIYETAREQMAFLFPKAAILQQILAKPSGRPGWIQYFGVNYAKTDNTGVRQRVDRATLLRVAKDQYDAAVKLKKKGKDVQAFRMFQRLITNSPDRTIALQASRWAKSMQADFAFMSRYRKDEIARSRNQVKLKDDSPWVLGQGFMQIDPHTFVMLKMEVAKENYDEVKPIFEGVIRSLRVDSPRELEEQRTNLVKAGDAVKNLLTFDRLKEVVRMWDKRGGKVEVPHAELWQRIVQDQSDIGWMRTVFTVRKDRRLTREIARDANGNLLRDEKGHVVHRIIVKEDGVQGIGADIQARILVGEQAVDTETRIFLSGDRTFETWATKTTVRSSTPTKKEAPSNPNIIRGGKQPAPPPGSGDETTWLESGMRNYNQITIIREGPVAGRIKRYLYEKPKDGYLSQVALFLIGPLLPRDGDNEYAFYAYYPNTGTISFRTVRCVGKGDGSFTIYSRPAPDQAEQVSEYNQAGLMVKRSLSEGRQILPTSRKQLAAIWKTELPKDAPTVTPVQPGTLPTNRVPR